MSFWFSKGIVQRLGKLKNVTSSSGLGVQAHRACACTHTHIYSLILSPSFTHSDPFWGERLYIYYIVLRHYSSAFICLHECWVFISPLCWCLSLTLCCILEVCGHAQRRLSFQSCSSVTVAPEVSGGQGGMRQRSALAAFPLGILEPV